MTIIVASLFLPFQPEFKVDDSEFKAAELAESKLVKLDSLDVDSIVNKPKRSSSVHSNPPFLKSSKEIPNEPTVLEDVPVVSSEQFLENLTAHAQNPINTTATETNSNPVNTNRESVEEFFNAANPEDELAADGPASDVAVDSGSGHPASLNAVFSKLGGAHSSDAASKTVVRPKSRPIPDFTAAVVDVAKLKQMHIEMNAQPSMKRVPVSAVPETSLELVEEVSEDESDLETESRQDYVVPQFGGFSSTKGGPTSQRLKNSYELFAQLPWSIVPNEKGNGALKNAMFIGTNEKTITDEVEWVGTVGIPTDEIPPDISTAITNKLKDEFNCTAVVSDDVTFKGAYKNFCKQILWPTLHYQIPDNPNSKAFEDHSWNYYKDLNQLFANKIAQVYKEGDTIWIHDYHLLLVPQMVRKLLPHAKIGFFLHVSFPSSEVFKCFAQREKILKGILGANCVGFQTTEYARHFLQTSSRLLMADVTKEDALKYKGCIISVKSVPVGIDTFSLFDQLKKEKVQSWRNMIKERWAGKKLIICRDQSDKIRGINKKMLAYERFLLENPSYIGNIVLIQIFLGKSEDNEDQKQVMLIVDRINSLSSNISMSQPVVFLHKELEFEQYLALNSEADLFFVNSLREGMNLTCHEFLASSEQKNAPLLLSEFTGSASVLGEGSILINPWDIKHVSKSIKRGLEMPCQERRRNWKSLMKVIIENDSDNWVKTCLQGIDNAWESSQERNTVFNLSYDTLYEDYKKSKKRMFIFKISEPPTGRTITFLNELTAKNIVFVMNSHTKATLERLYARVPNLGLIAENGAYVRINDLWYNIVQQVNWKSQVIKILDDKIERLPGSYYKIAESMIRFHTENAEDQDRVAGVIGEAITHINTLFYDKNVHAYIHKGILFVQETGLSLAAFQFLMNVYNTSSSANSTVTGDSQDIIEFISITGSSSPVIEPLFNCIKEEQNAKKIQNGHGIVYGDTSSTNAKEHVNGLNELLIVLQKLLDSSE
ncbi:trehalose 6-phosphate synthase/phosphatase complex subunit KNAG_0G03290 [Huiozyma naganishii CBS 8797]|uniref:Uncharacterized protein n=1 Tax=Huiozyma naganishii (strain ATCC MYA-139 / BCRC 22969 / CBS 8797 / KCTC 17520 / NBRC 10181 / NCYC 3082 / Yp74L-3) TaxID=1071383 RepID=J7S1B7_HUIN7|nr:hypothetical protein KNAG_0G03290 [Kazachstania naganishii CBS 8797]CCK71387.1 hypothetical protein KNAG_0G03290 [Kazachstania naganishii CBS 8797]